MDQGHLVVAIHPGAITVAVGVHAAAAVRLVNLAVAVIVDGIAADLQGPGVDVRVGILGYGGKNYHMADFHLRGLAASGMTAVAVADTQPQRLELVRKNHPSLETYGSLREMIRQAEWVAGVQYTDDERSQMLDGVNELLDAFAELRELPLDNKVPPALFFRPTALEVAGGDSGEDRVRPTRTASPPPFRRRPGR